MWKQIGIVLILTRIAGITVPAVESARDFSQAPRPADEFVDSIGVNIHLGYGDTVYHLFDEIVKPRLVELGVRHVRDGLRPDRKDVILKLNALAAAGIHADLIVRAEDAVAICRPVLKPWRASNAPMNRTIAATGNPTGPNIRAANRRLYSGA